MRIADRPVATVLAAATLVAGTVLSPINLLVSNTRSSLAAAAAASHAPAHQITAAQIASVDSRLSALTRTQKFSGAVVIAQGGKVLLRKGYGMADWSKQIHNTPDTVDAYDMSVFGGELYSTANDLLRLEEAIDSGSMLSAASSSRIDTPTYITCRTVAHCGSGYSTEGTSEGRNTGIWSSHRLTIQWGELPDIGLRNEVNFFPNEKILEIRLLNLNVPFPSLGPLFLS